MSTSTSEIIIAISVVFSVVFLIGICIVAHKYYLLMEEIRRESIRSFEIGKAQRLAAIEKKHALSFEYLKEEPSKSKQS